MKKKSINRKRKRKKKGDIYIFFRGEKKGKERNREKDISIFSIFLARKKKKEEKKYMDTEGQDSRMNPEESRIQSTQPVSHHTATNLGGRMSILEEALQ